MHSIHQANYYIKTYSDRQHAVGESDLNSYTNTLYTVTLRLTLFQMIIHTALKHL